ncbi:MAG: HD domain-containing protein [Gammaproteobacteria bacterium]|nr:HD domain-containing protein [Gammaproteobacteria bacterium]
MADQHRRLTEDELHAGVPLPWNVYDANGRLLLRSGNLIDSKQQIEALCALGLFRALTAADAAKDDAPQPAVKLSPFDTINLFQYRLKGIFAEINKPSGAAVKELLANFAHDVQTLCTQDLDAGLGALHLDNEGHYTHIHPIHTALLAELIGKRLGLGDAERQSIIGAALTANIGMVDLQELLHLQKEPLTALQRKEVWGHPERSVELLKGAGIDDMLLLDTVQSHHERMDGSGYPKGLSGTSIPMSVRMISLADTYSAMVTPRAYRVELQAKEALKEIFLRRGKEIDESLAHVFIKELGIYPPGAWVRLENGEIAVVIRRGKNATNPIVQSIISPRGGAYTTPHRHSCEQQMYQIKEVVRNEKNCAFSVRTLWGYE